jgi:hypothetical protein
VLVQEHGAELGELPRRVFELGQDDRALVDRERNQLHLVGEGTLETIGQVVGAPVFLTVSVSSATATA